MEKKIKISELPDFDMAQYLKSEEDIAAYLSMVIADGDTSELAYALGVAAKARGMSEVAKKAGITREALYRALRPNASPRFDTINKVCQALGVRLEVKPVHG
ncbi:MAG: putative addiction module antidote protein [Desulfobulbaceae bacterium]|jgi:probable addiction module antidote protein|nr:putative addiction module antidote protein [Desulfobulbaceae bacterium]